MSLNETPNAMRAHIGFFGRTNAGKSSLVNAVTNQSMSVVSPVSGTTTDPVKKAMELLPAGPVVIIDTPGFDDSGLLGQLRVEKTKETLRKTDLAVLVTDKKEGFDSFEGELVDLFRANGVPYVVARNKKDLWDNVTENTRDNEVFTSSVTKEGVQELKELIAQTLVKFTSPTGKMVSDTIKENDLVVLVIPIDQSAPKGRLILPQQMVMRDILDANAQVLAVKDTELENVFETIGKKPALVITDSQVFGKVKKIVPKDVLLTSFSIVMARFKGFLDSAVKGAKELDLLNDGDKVLVCEGCSHHRQCGDIGTQKLPKWILEYTGKNIEFDFTQGSDFPENLKDFALIVHCGGCMLTEREVARRRKMAEYHGVPFTNYGTTIAQINGILDVSLEFLKEKGE